VATSTDRPSPTAPATPGRGPLRLDLAAVLGAGADDGEWWPRSRDFAVEAADLVDHFPPQLGQVNRLVFSRPDWDSAPHRLVVDHRLIKVGSYPVDDGHRLMLAMSDKRLIRLRVKAFDAA
jgi:hypothetical protein